MRVTAPLRLKVAVRERGREQLAPLRRAAMMSGSGAVMMKESFERFGEVWGAKKRRWAAGSGRGPLVKLLLLDAAT